MTDISEPGAPGNDDDRYADEMLERIIAMDNERLAKEIAFAEGFGAPPEGDEAETRWITMLREEYAERLRKQSVEKAGVTDDTAVADTGEVRVLFRPTITVAVAGTMGDLTVNWCDIEDWSQIIDGVLRDGDIVYPGTTGADDIIANRASEYLDDPELQRRVSQALRVRD